MKEWPTFNEAEHAFCNKSVLMCSVLHERTPTGLTENKNAEPGDTNSTQRRACMKFIISHTAVLIFADIKVLL